MSAFKGGAGRRAAKREGGDPPARRRVPGGATAPVGVFLRAALRRPGLAAEAARLAAAVAPRGWWRRPPYLPLPDSEYGEWRLTTAYGRPDRAPTVREMEEFLAWRRRMRRARAR